MLRDLGRQLDRLGPAHNLDGDVPPVSGADNRLGTWHDTRLVKLMQNVGVKLHGLGEAANSAVPRSGGKGVLQGNNAVEKRFGFGKPELFQPRDRITVRRLGGVPARPARS